MTKRWAALALRYRREMNAPAARRLIGCSGVVRNGELQRRVLLRERVTLPRSLLRELFADAGATMTGHWARPNPRRARTV